MKPHLLLLVLALMGTTPLPATDSKIKMAVKRGQTTVDPALLPLACLTFVLDHATMPLDRVVLKNSETHDEIIAAVGSQDPTHPHVLTAMQGEHRVLTMVILHLNAGRYQVESLEFEGKKLVHFRMALYKTGQWSFEVKPACVNYVGSLIISTDWENFTLGATELPSTIEVDQSQQRDWKWATDIVPGLASLPPGASKFEVQGEPKK